MKGLLVAGAESERLEPLKRLPHFVEPLLRQLLRAFHL